MTTGGETPASVLDFWFGAGKTLDEHNRFWFGGKADTDAIIKQRFAPLLDRLAAGEAHDWAARGPRERLAAIIVLDQFSRNIHRGSGKAFAADPLARQLTNEALAAGEDQKLPLVERWFLFLPLEHSEDMADQQRSMDLFHALIALAPEADRKHFERTSDYAVRHAEVIRQFGRFPHRNKALGRTSTPEEQAWLDAGGGF